MLKQHKVLSKSTNTTMNSFVDHNKVAEPWDDESVFSALEGDFVWRGVDDRVELSGRMARPPFCPRTPKNHDLLSGDLLGNICDFRGNYLEEERYKAVLAHRTSELEKCKMDLIRHKEVLRELRNLDLARSNHCAEQDEYEMISTPGDERVADYANLREFNEEAIRTIWVKRFESFDDEMSAKRAELEKLKKEVVVVSELEHQMMTLLRKRNQCARLKDEYEALKLQLEQDGEELQDTKDEITPLIDRLEKLLRYEPYKVELKKLAQKIKKYKSVDKRRYYIEQLRLKAVSFNKSSIMIGHDLDVDQEKGIAMIEEEERLQSYEGSKTDPLTIYGDGKVSWDEVYQMPLDWRKQYAEYHNPLHDINLEIEDYKREVSCKGYFEREIEKTSRFELGFKEISEMCETAKAQLAEKKRKREKELENGNPKRKMTNAEYDRLHAIHSQHDYESENEHDWMPETIMARNWDTRQELLVKSFKLMLRIAKEKKMTFADLFVSQFPECLEAVLFHIYCFAFTQRSVILRANHDPSLEEFKYDLNCLFCDENQYRFGRKNGKYCTQFAAPDDEPHVCDLDRLKKFLPMDTAKTDTKKKAGIIEKAIEVLGSDVKCITAYAILMRKPTMLSGLLNALALAGAAQTGNYDARRLGEMMARCDFKDEQTEVFFTLSGFTRYFKKLSGPYFYKLSDAGCGEIPYFDKFWKKYHMSTRKVMLNANIEKGIEVKKEGFAKGFANGFSMVNPSK